MASLIIKGVTTLVDDEDVDLIKSQNWWFCRRTGYFLTKVGHGRKGRRTMGMHRFILGDPDCESVDHINRNKLDNRRKNLRQVTCSENCKNKSKFKIRGACHSEHKGVSRNRDKWSVVVRINGKLKWIGSYNTENEAAEAAAPYFDYE